MWEEKISLKLPWAFAGISCSLSTQWWVYASNLRQLSTWQGQESPQRQTSIWAQLDYSVSQAGILTSSIWWLCVLELCGLFRSESHWRRRGDLRTGSCSRVTESHADTFLWPGINTAPQLTQQIWENTLAVDPEEELERHSEHSRRLHCPHQWWLMLIIISTAFWITVCGHFGEVISGLGYLRWEEPP